MALVAKDSVRAALVQASPVVGDVQANTAKVRETVEAVEADLYLFGELFLSGYMARDLLPKLAEPLTGKTIGKLAAVAEEHGAEIILGFPERDEETDIIYDSSLFLSQRGRIESYRKIYPANFGPFEELEYFGRGHELKIVESVAGKVGLMVCYDAFFPEVGKALALRGAEVLAIVSAGPHTSKPFFDLVLPARAVENTTFVLYSNLVGTELNMVFAGGTQALGPRGDELGRAEDFKEQVVEVDLRRRDLGVARRFRPTLRDTRPDILRLLAESPIRQEKVRVEGRGGPGLPTPRK